MNKVSKFKMFSELAELYKRLWKSDKSFRTAIAKKGIALVKSYVDGNDLRYYYYDADQKLSPDKYILEKEVFTDYGICIREIELMDIFGYLELETAYAYMMAEACIVFAPVSDGSFRVVVVMDAYPEYLEKDMCLIKTGKGLVWSKRGDVPKDLFESLQDISADNIESPLYERVHMVEDEPFLSTYYGDRVESNPMEDTAHVDALYDMLDWTSSLSFEVKEVIWFNYERLSEDISPKVKYRAKKCPDGEYIVVII